MQDYSPKRRTALVFTGCGASGAYHAGVLKALDESGVKLDLVVGSGVGTLAAAFAAVAGGAKLYGDAGFWSGLRWGSVYRLRPALKTLLTLLGLALGVFLLPLGLALGLGVVSLLVPVVNLFQPGFATRALGVVAQAPAVLRQPYLLALTAPIFVLCVIATAWCLQLIRQGRRLPESLESAYAAEPGLARLRRLLWEVARGPTLSTAPDSEHDLAKRYVSLAGENLGQPGFRELILRAADLDAGGALCLALLHEDRRGAFAAARGAAASLDLRAPGAEGLFFDVVATALAPPLLAPLRRVSFPRGGPFAGQTHRLADATLAAGCGLAEALATGAEQVVVVTAVPEAVALPPRRRGLRPLADGALALLERQAVDREIQAAEQLNRLVETLGLRGADGRREWVDPATGRRHRAFGLYVIRPERRGIGPLELDGARDPASEVLETPADLIELGYRDAYRLFVEPVVGAAPESARSAAAEAEEGQPVEL